MHTERWFLNTVLLPDSRIFVVGGGSGTTFGCSTDPALTPEVIDAAQPAGSRIRELWPSTIVRDYHSTAVLLPDGRVLTGGGESRRTGAQNDCEDPNPANVVAPADYQIFDPDYVVCGGGDRPSITQVTDLGLNVVTTLQYGGEYYVEHAPLSEGTTIQKVTLVRAGSVTHHHDGNQRCVQLNMLLSDNDRVRIFMPLKEHGILPRGYYMLFLTNNQTVATQGVPSVAHWVKVE